MTDPAKKAVAAQTDDRPERRVLVVDDVPEIGELHRAILRRVRSVRVRAIIEVRGDRAIEVLHQSRFDLIITDLRMPGATGRQVIAAARATQPDTPIILMSGYLGAAGEVQGTAAIVEKPLNTGRMVELIERLLTEGREGAGPLHEGKTDARSERNPGGPAVSLDETAPREAGSPRAGSTL